MDILEGFSWHSSVGIDDVLGEGKRFVTRIRATKRAMTMFDAAGNDLLIHKTTRCLWKLSDDKTHIEPVFGNDVLSEDEAAEVTKEG